MKKLLAILSVVLFANQASADAEYLCNAWTGGFADKKPFILKKENTAIKFKDYLGFAVTATYAGNHNHALSIYHAKGKNFVTIYYFNDPETATRELDSTLIEVNPYDSIHAAKCYSK